jgi:hypothetical protein
MSAANQGSHGSIRRDLLLAGGAAFTALGGSAIG